jgi:hypothetical protein
VSINVDDGTLWPHRFSSIIASAAASVISESPVTIGQLVGTIGSQTKTIGQYDITRLSLMVGGSTGQVYQDSGYTDNGSAIPAFFQTGLSDMGNPVTFKTVQEIDHVFSKAANSQSVSVSIAKSDYGDDLSLSTASTLAIGSAGPYKSGHRVTGRALGMRVDVSASQSVRWQGASVGVVQRGMR